MRTVKAMMGKERSVQNRCWRALAAMALLFALLLPASASAGARVSDEAVAQWESSIYSYTPYGRDADEALLDAFSGDEFDGAVIESYAIEDFYARMGAAVLRLADGTLRVYALAADDAGLWHIAEHTGDLASVEGVDRASVSYSIWMTVYLYGGEQSKGRLEFKGEPGELALSHFTGWDTGFVAAYVSELEELRFDDVWWSGNFSDPDGRGEARVTARAEATYLRTVFESESIARMDEFSLAFREFDLGELLDVLSVKTREGISYIDEDMTVQAFAAREANGIAADIPALPEPPGFAHALPAPELAHFTPNQRFDVYTGPGKGYMREANGKASLSTNDWTLVFGEEDGWLMIAYRVSEEQVRFGWIQATQEQAGVSVPVLSWADEPVMLSEGVTSNPLYDTKPAATGPSQQSSPGTLLGALNESWAYVETKSPDGALMRGFVGVEDFYYAPPDDALARVCLPKDEFAALYDAPGGEEIGKLYPGIDLAVKEERDGMLRVVCYTRDYYLPSLDLFVQGWVDAQAVVRGAQALEEVDYSAMRIVVEESENAAREDMPPEITVGLALLAEVGDKAYLMTTNGDMHGVTYGADEWF